jgi:hypothetical protein
MKVINLSVSWCCLQTSLFARYGGDMATDDRKSKLEVLRGTTSSNSNNNSNNNNNSSSSSAGRHRSDEELEKALSRLRSDYRRQLKGVQWQGSLWFRNLQDSRSFNEGVFTKAYAALDNGSLFFYRSQDEYLHFTSTLEANRRLKLLDFELESSAKRVAGLDKQGVSLNKALRSAVFGTDELGFVDRMTADFDVTAASSAYKFCLVPKVRAVC